MEAKLVHVPVEAGSEHNNLLKENGKMSHGSVITEPIKFGSHGTEEPKKEEVSRTPVSNVPKDAVEDWPEPKQIHSFYIVKFRRFEDPKLKAKIELAERELQKKNQARSQIIEKLKAKRVSFWVNLTSAEYFKIIYCLCYSVCSIVLSLLNCQSSGVVYNMILSSFLSFSFSCLVYILFLHAHIRVSV